MDKNDNSIGYISMLFFVMMSCQPTVAYQDNWSHTVSICNFTPTSGATEVPVIGARVYPSEACVDAVIADFNIDVEGFQEQERFSSIYGHVYGDNDVRGSKYELLLLNARALLQSDIGLMDDVEANEILTEQFLHQMRTVQRHTGVSENAGIFYNFAASIIEETIPANKPSARASFSAQDKKLRISKGIRDQYVLGTVLVHESRHLWKSHQTCQWDEAKSCDPDATGAYGYGMAAKLLTFQHTSDIQGRVELDRTIRKLFNRIEAFNSPDGELLAHWENLTLEDL